MGLLNGKDGKFIPNCKPQEGTGDQHILECNPGHLDEEDEGQFIPESLRPVIIVKDKNKVGIYDDGGINVKTMAKLREHLEKN